MMNNMRKSIFTNVLKLSKTSYRMTSVFATPCYGNAVLEDWVSCRKLNMLKVKHHFKIGQCAFRQNVRYSKDCDEIGITCDELQDLTERKKMVVVDVRSADEVSLYGKIPDSVNIPMDEIDFALNLNDEFFKTKYGVNKPLDDGENVVFYCQIGVRSHQTMVFARNLGMEKAKHLSGGYKAWLEFQANIADS